MGGVERLPVPGQEFGNAPGRVVVRNAGEQRGVMPPDPPPEEGAEAAPARTSRGKRAASLERLSYIAVRRAPPEPSEG